MTLNEIIKILDAEIIEECDLQKDIEMVSACDLMSDVLMFTKPNSLLLTGLTTSQVVSSAEITEIAAICFVRGKKPNEQTIALAREDGIPLLSTKMSMYKSCGKLYSMDLPGSPVQLDHELMESSYHRDE